MDSTTKYTIDYVLSADGTRIGYRMIGSGPGVILVHGAMMTSQNFIKLGRHLSHDFTVYIPDRQGRATSEPHINGFGLEKETDDITALIEKTGAQNIFGLSSGAIITLETAIRTKGLRKVVLYEPPLPADGELFSDWYSDYESAIAKGNYGRAFVEVIKGTMQSAWFKAIPSIITSSFFNFLIKMQAKQLKTGEVSLRSLVEAFRYDYKVVKDAEDITARIKNIQADILLMGGTKSPKYLLDALSRLHDVIPNASMTILKGLDHTGPDNNDQPEIIAKQLRRFFADTL